jgi:predicted DNA-binding transcriptional regulator YafY
MRALDLATQLEVTERTIYRDVIALSTAGVPIYTERGPGGGISLIESYRSDLTGLTREELRALFSMSIPAEFSALGLDKELRAAMIKLSATLPRSSRGDHGQLQQRIHVDTQSWHRSIEHLPHLQTLYQAVWNEKVLTIKYRSAVRVFLEPLQAEVNPLGLVAKAGIWYLVCEKDDYHLVLRVDRIIETQSAGDKFTRPDNFELLPYWGSWCQDMEQRSPYFPVKVLLSQTMIPLLTMEFGEDILDTITESLDTDRNGWLHLTLPFETFEAARAKLLSYGGAVEVIEPIALRMSIQDYAEQIIRLYNTQTQREG